MLAVVPLVRPLPYALTLSCISPRRNCQTTTSDRTGCRALGIGWRKSVDLQTFALWCDFYVDRYFASIHLPREQPTTHRRGGAEMSRDCQERINGQRARHGTSLDVIREKKLSD